MGAEAAECEMASFEGEAVVPGDSVRDGLDEGHWHVQDCAAAAAGEMAVVVASQVVDGRPVADV